MDVESDRGEHSSRSNSSSESDGEGGGAGGPDPWVQTRVLASQAAGVARHTTRTKRTKKPSRRWPSAAGKMLMEWLEARPELPKPSDPAKFCFKWGARLLKTGSVHDAPRSGRRSKLPPEAVEEALALIASVKPGSQREMNEHGAFQAICEKHGVSSQTLWKKLRKKDPRLVHAVTSTRHSRRRRGQGATDAVRAAD